MNKLNDNIKEAIKLLCIAIIFILTYIVTYKEFSVPTNDYIVHSSIAVSQGIIPDGNVEFLWHSAVAFIYKLVPGIPLAHAASIVSSIANAATYGLIYKYIGRRHTASNTVVSVLALAIMFVGPLYIPWFNENYYLGQYISNTWHNPTNLMVKPFVVLSFYYIVKILDGFNDGNYNKKDYICLAIIAPLSCIAKPSWIQIIIPALAIYLIMLLACSRTKKTFLFCLRVASSFVPAVLVILIQFIYLFGHVTEEQTSGIVIKPFYCWLQYSNSPIISFLISMSFPIVVFVCNIKKLRDTDVKLSIYLIISGFLEYILLVEDGPRANDGNFGWGAALSVLITHVVAMEKFLSFNDICDTAQIRDKIKLYFQWLMLFLNLWFGIRYYYQLVTVPGMWL